MVKIIGCEKVTRILVTIFSSKMKILIGIIAVTYGATSFATKAHEKHNEKRQLHKNTPNLILDDSLSAQAQVFFTFKRRFFKQFYSYNTVVKLMPTSSSI